MSSSYESRLLDTKQVAEMLRVSIKTVRRKIDSGELPKPRRMGRLLRWRLCDIERYISKLR